MAQHATVVYYSEDKTNAEVFHVIDFNKIKLQKEFKEYDVWEIKIIELETESGINRFFTEDDIKGFLNYWEINFSPKEVG